MTAGPAPEAAARRPAGRGTNAASRLRELVTYALGREDLMGALFVLVLGLLLLPLGPPRLGQKLGDVAERDVMADRAFRVRDDDATERERLASLSRVPFTFDADPTPLDQSLSTVTALYSAGRDAARAMELGELARADDVAVSGGRAAPLDPAVILLLSRADLPEGVPVDLLPALHRTLFDAAHEESLRSIMRAVLGKRIGSFADGLEPYRGRPIEVRDRMTGAIEKAGSIDDAVAPDKARSLLSFELNQAGDLWDRPTRQLLEPWLASMVRENFWFNKERFGLRKLEARGQVPDLYIEVKKGEKIIGRGERVGPEALQKLTALHEASRTSGSGLRVVGTVILLAMFAYGLLRYVAYHQASEKRVVNLYGMVVLAFLSGALLVEASLLVGRGLAERFDSAPYNQIDPYLFLSPYATGSLVLVLLVDSEIAMVFAVSFSLIAGLIANPAGDYTVALYALISGFGAIYFTGPYLKRTAVMRSGVAIGLTSAVAVLGVAFHRGTWNDTPLLLFSVACAASSGMLAAMAGQVLLPLFESVFGILTDLKLVELMSANHPLISELALRAPGTYNHSIVVGTLAEAAGKAIGVNPLFMRAASYYHDVGKMKMPEYFIENQQPGVNKHDKLAPSLSALIVKSHVKDGVEMARAHGLPEELIEMIPAHHGTRKLEYFYSKAKQLEDETLSPVNEADYRYPGPRPRTKAGAIMMLTDAVEAAARSLQDPTSQKFRNVIDKMTERIYLDGQLDETDLTLEDLKAIKEAFYKVLLSVYHHRIHYPGFDFERRSEEKRPKTPPRAVVGEPEERG